MDRLACMRTLVEVVSCGSFTAAAERLQLSRAGVSRQVQVLEEALGARLLNRTTRRVAPTEVGLAYFERCRRVLAEIEDAEAEVADLQAHPRGLLKLNAPMSFGTLHLAAAVVDFMQACPDVEVQMVLNDRFVDLLAEGFDVALRIGELADSSLVARRIASSRMVLCAAPAYLAAHGEPSHPRDLAGHECLQYGYQATGNRWRLHGAGTHTVAIGGRLCVNNGEVLLQAAVAGLGIVLGPTFILGPSLRAGSLVPVLPDWSVADSGIHVVYPHAAGLSAKVRAFVDFMAARFEGTLPWDPVPGDAGARA